MNPSDAMRSAAQNPVVLQSPLLQGLPEAVVRDFLSRADFTRLAPHQTVFRAGDPARVHLVVSGRVKITRLGEHGRENILIIAGPGELLGSLNIFEHLPQPTSAVTLGPAEFLGLSTESMIEWLQAHTEASMSFIRLLIARSQRQNDAIHDIFGLDVGTRVARAIMRAAERAGRRTPEGLRVNLALNQEELALHVRASRESVNQALSSFTKQGWILRDGTEILIRDEDQLMQRAFRDT
jgi:CRP-like cAMP-binding protein